MCIGNSVCRQMAQGFLRYFGSNKWQAHSAALEKQLPNSIKRELIVLYKKGIRIDMNIFNKAISKALVIFAVIFFFSFAQSLFSTPFLKQEGEGEKGFSNSKKAGVFDNIHLYTQLRFTATIGKEPLYAIRRFKMSLNQPIGQRAKIYLQAIYKEGNGSSTDGHLYLQDAYCDLKISKSLDLKIGQFIPPFGLERFTSDAVIYTIDRSQVIDRLIPDGKLNSSFARDRGIQLNHRLLKDRLLCSVAVFDGNGANNSFKGNGPLYGLRIILQPYGNRIIKKEKLSVEFQSAFSYRKCRNLAFSSNLCGSSALKYSCFRGMDFRYNLAGGLDYKGFSWRMEYIRAFFDSFLPELVDIIASGFYLQAAYYFNPELQMAAKYERFDQNKAIIDQYDFIWKTIGFNYYIIGNKFKLMANYIFKSERAFSLDNDAFLFQLQYFLK